MGKLLNLGNESLCNKRYVRTAGKSGPSQAYFLPIGDSFLRFVLSSGHAAHFRCLDRSCLVVFILQCEQPCKKKPTKIVNKLRARTCSVNIDLVTFAAMETILLKFRAPSLCLLGAQNTF